MSVSSNKIAAESLTMEEAPINEVILVMRNVSRIKAVIFLSS